MSISPGDNIRTTPWEPPAPRGVPDLRAAMALQMRNPWEAAQTAEALRSGRGSVVPPGTHSPEEAASLLCEEEYQRLSTAELFMATKEMSRLAVIAGESLPDFHLEPEDVPAPTGFLVFGAPIGSYVNTDSDLGIPIRVPIVAVSWGQYRPPGPPRGGVWLTYYTPTDWRTIEEVIAGDLGRPVRQKERARLRAMKGPLTWDNEAFMGYWIDRKASYAPGSSYDAALDVFAPWWQTVRAVWLLMSQPNIAEVEVFDRPRTLRRRDEREGLNPGAVRLLHLRRPPAGSGVEGEDEVGGREYTCRWMVRGHWRQQWYKSRDGHRPIWISPHIKGPEGKPLRTGETVHIWDR